MIICERSRKPITFDSEDGRWIEDRSADTHPDPCRPAAAAMVSEYTGPFECDGPDRTRLHLATLRVGDGLYACASHLTEIMGVALLPDQVRIRVTPVG